MIDTRAARRLRRQLRFMERNQRYYLARVLVCESICREASDTEVAKLFRQAREGTDNLHNAIAKPLRDAVDLRAKQAALAEAVKKARGKETPDCETKPNESLH